jgi:hypothetical protein
MTARQPSRMRLIAAMGIAGALGGCRATSAPAPALDEIYSHAAQRIGAERDPVVVIPGILGSNLVDGETGQVVWGAFIRGAADADFPDGARLVALPMREGAPLRDLRDGVVPDGVLESLEVDVGIVRITALEPYRGIIEALAAGKYVDRDIALAQARSAAATRGAVDYAGLHFTCFQLDYDWRRDEGGGGRRLDEIIRGAAEATRRARGTDEPVRVDVVAHSMGGMVLLYYLRYGTQELPVDGSLPPVTWAGAANVGNAIIVGTPSAGSVLALRQLVQGVRYAPIAPYYRPAVVGSMPAVYQLLPRDRHARVVDAATGEPVGSLFDVATWEKYEWGLASPSQDKYVAWLLPDEPDPAVRRRIALDHLRKCLARAEQLHRALDAPMRAGPPPPEHLTISLVLGDADRTASVLAVDPRTGALSIREAAPGDGTVTRASALMDERLGRGAEDFPPRLRSPVRWDRVQFIPTDHVALTRHPSFVDGLLYDLLERPR